MPESFAKLIPEAQSFLADLSANNNRDWFQANKDRYETGLKTPAKMLLKQMRGPLEELSGQSLATKLFRPQRDVRFSKDKTPYHTHLHLLWGAEDGPGWFLGISPEYVTAGAGMMGFHKKVLMRYRAALDSPAGDDLAQVIKDINPRLSKPELKRVPPPFDKEHRHGDLLRHKSLVVWRDDLQEQLAGDLPKALLAVFEELAPIPNWLRDEV